MAMPGSDLSAQDRTWGQHRGFQTQEEEGRRDRICPPPPCNRIATGSKSGEGGFHKGGWVKCSTTDAQCPVFCVTCVCWSWSFVGAVEGGGGGGGLTSDTSNCIKAC